MPPKKAKGKGPAGADDGSFVVTVDANVSLAHGDAKICCDGHAPFAPTARRRGEGRGRWTLTPASCFACVVAPPGGMRAVDVNKQLRDNYVKACKYALLS